MAWRAPSAHDSALFEEVDNESSSRTSLSRWRSARSIARRARRLASVATVQLDTTGAAVEAAGLEGVDNPWAPAGEGHNALLSSLNPREDTVADGVGALRADSPREAVNVSPVLR